MNMSIYRVFSPALAVTAFLLLPSLLAANTANAAAAAEKSTENEEIETAPPAPSAPNDQSGSIQPDLKRGNIVLNAAGGQYEEKNHFAYWNWDFEALRPGTYEVRVIYTSVRLKKMGLQFRFDDTAVLKAYVYRSRKPDAADEYVIGRLHIPAKGKHHITLLTADKSKDPPFSIKGVKLVPAQESEQQLGQGLDGMVELHASDAITHAEKMQYEEKPEKNCLGYWVELKDWAEWDFHVSMPGKFKVSLVYGCGDKSGGSEVALLTSNDQVLKFTVKETGGFQKWQTLELGTIELSEEGSHRVAIQALSKPGNAVMDIRKIALTPVK